MNFFIIRVCLVLSVFSIVGCYRNNSTEKTQEQQSVTVTNSLANTTWVVADAYGGIGNSLDVSQRITLDFGETSVKLGSKTISSGITFDDKSVTGTYKKFGDTVTFNFPDFEITGTLIGNTLTLDETEFRRIQ